DDLGDAALERLIEHHLTPLEASDDLGREVVRGRAQAAAGEHHVEPLAGHEAERRMHVLWPVSDDRRVREIDSQLAQALGEPGAVSIAHPPAHLLGAGDDYPPYISLFHVR